MTSSDRLEIMIRTYENTLYRSALAILGDPHEAQDVVQETFLRLWEKAPEFQNPAHERAWLLKVAVNNCKSRLRSSWRRRTTPLLDSYPAAGPEEQAVLEVIQSMPPKERAVLHLYYYEGYQTAEIAAMTGWREGTVRSRLARARDKLRELLKGEWE